MSEIPDDEWDAMDPKEQLFRDFNRWATPARRKAIAEAAAAAPPVTLPRQGNPNPIGVLLRRLYPVTRSINN